MRCPPHLPCQTLGGDSDFRLWKELERGYSPWTPTRGAEASIGPQDTPRGAVKGRIAQPGPPSTSGQRGLGQPGTPHSSPHGNLMLLLLGRRA